MAGNEDAGRLDFNPEGDFATNLQHALEALPDRDLAAILGRNARNIIKLDSENSISRRQPILQDLKDLIDSRLEGS
jgi:hypothetical protein